jgi:hypothetical protein
MSDYLVQSVHKKCERWCFTILELLHEFPQISHVDFYYEIFTGSRLAVKHSGVHETQRKALDLAFNFLEQHHKDRNEFLKHAV